MKGTLTEAIAYKKTVGPPTASNIDHSPVSARLKYSTIKKATDNYQRLMS